MMFMLRQKGTEAIDDMSPLDTLCQKIYRQKRSATLNCFCYSRSRLCVGSQPNLLVLLIQ